MKRILACFMLIITLCLVSCEAYYRSQYEEIKLDDVAFANVWNDKTGTDRSLTVDEISELVELYNNAPYGGEKDLDDGDTTPEFGLTIQLKDGKTIRLYDFGFLGHPLEVHADDGFNLFIDSKELADYIEGLE